MNVANDDVAIFGAAAPKNEDKKILTSISPQIFFSYSWNVA